MSSGQAHDIITIVTSIPCICVIAFFFGIFPALYFGLAYLFAGFAFNGDLDILSQTYHRWLILKYIWIPYRRFGHRSRLTHGFIIGTIIRLLWIAPIVIGILYLCNVTYPVFVSYLINHLGVFIWSIIGLESGAMSHTIADMMSTTWKKL